MHGSKNGRPLRPDFRIEFKGSAAGQIIGITGTVNAGAITSITLRTSTGIIRGPIGGGGGQPFSVDGLVLGFFGAFDKGAIAITGIGVWYTPELISTFPTGLEMTPAYGNLDNTWAWQDTLNLGGAHSF
jgi:hypothetical protein